MPALIRIPLVCTLLLFTLSWVQGLGVSAQSTPEANNYVRTSDEYTAPFADVISELDAYWSANFVQAGMTYRSPGVVALVAEIDTACRVAGPQDFAFYCPLDNTIYYSPMGFAVHDQRFGDFAPIVVMAHEWGHHVQTLSGIVPELGNAFELQADCFAGAYASEAGQQGLLDPGDVTEAVAGSAEAGDPIGLPQDAPGAHGINDDRVIAFMTGYLDGVGGCGWPPSVAPQGPAPPQNPVELSINALLPDALELPQGQAFRLEAEGISTFEDMVAGLPPAEETRRLLPVWGWEQNVYRTYSADAPPVNAVGWITLGIHRFSSVDGAANALPYFAEARRNALGFDPVDVGLFADQTEAMAGEARNGREVIIYARRGNLIFRVDGIAPNGDPTEDVLETLLIPLRQLVDDPRVISAALFDQLPTDRQVPFGMHLSEEHARSAGSIAATFPDVAEAERLFQDWDWRESAARVFTGETPTGTTRLEVSVFRLANAQAAAEALPYFLDARAQALRLLELQPPIAQADEIRAVGLSGVEITVYVRRGVDLYRVSAIGDGNSWPDIVALFSAW